MLKVIPNKLHHAKLKVVKLYTIKLKIIKGLGFALALSYWRQHQSIVYHNVRLAYIIVYK